MERNQYGAIVLDLGAFVLTRRHRLSRFRERAARAQFLATRVQELAEKYRAERVVTETGGCADEVRALGIRVTELSLTQVKALLLPVAVGRTNRALFEAVIAKLPQLRKFGAIDEKAEVLSLGEPDRWRTVVLMAAAFVLAAKHHI